jgi:pimeloyl-ACP methyl ester carboxylesterase
VRQAKKRKNNTPFLLRLTRSVFPFLERWAPFVSNRIFRLVFYVPLRYRVPDKEKESEASARQFSLDIGGRNIQVYSWGDETHPYVLLVHGWAGRATQFRKFVEPLNAAGYRVVGFDGPGHGKSDGLKTSFFDFELSLHTIFRKVGEPTAIITHSFGGAATLYSAMNGLPVRRLVNIASPSVGDEILKTFLRAINGSWRSADKFRKYVVRNSGKTFDEFCALHTIQHLPQPIDLLIVQDEEDTDVIPMHAVELMKVYPSAKLFMTKGLGHSRILKDDAVIDRCVTFIRS